ncbi:Potassium channel subfamily K member 15 [Echinococcus granulosus]|uniref:Twik family of potassium channels n=1 Tax=Echinococcus granulosus TaxID=6210 RepID=A0A068W8R0_ECHGR|nr:Potassium channel subfamily K member 15 [Echinococcus granulosus]CDS15998.1 twik family of potassium channels [Echinococcus granulosus]
MPKSRKPWLLSRVCETIEGAGLLIGVVPTSAVTLRKPPTTVLEKETYSAELYKHRRRLKEIRAGFKRFLAFLFSQIGLSLLVIGYTIIGGMIFRAVELENEKMVKIKGKELRTALADQFSGEIIRELRYQISSLNTWQGKYYTPSLMNEKSSKKTIGARKNAIKNKARRRRGLGSHTESEFARLRQWLHVIAYTLRHKTRQELHRSLRKLVKMMDHEGWNGEDSMDDLKWSWEGSILFAVTVITTIGYGHAVPKTNAGKVLTIIYALVGIPLVFLYLTNIGDYLASLFRTLYTKVCQRCCEGTCVNKTETHRKVSIFNALRAQPSEIDLTQRRDFLLDESLHRSNINIIRRIGSLSVRRDKARNVKKEDHMVDCVGINVFCNEHAIDVDRKEQMEQKRQGEIKGIDAPPSESYRMCLKVTANPSQPFLLNTTNVKTECARKCALQTPPLYAASLQQVESETLQELVDRCDFRAPKSAANSPKKTWKNFSYTCGTQIPRKSMNGQCLVKPIGADASTLSPHNVGTQTALHAGPDDALTYRSLCKSFVTGQYFRSYRREMRHERKQMQRRLKIQSHGASARYKNDCYSDEFVWTLENRKSFLEVPSENHSSDSTNTFLSMRDFKLLSEVENQSNSAKSVSPTFNAKNGHKSKRSKEEPITMSSTSLPVKLEQQKVTSLQVAVDGGEVSPSRPTNPVLKSRLSVLSSLASSSNDLMIRLSYYSNENIYEADSTSRQRSLDSDDLDGKDISNVTVPISLSIMIMTTYILIGAIVFCIWEDPNYLKWSYFCFVTLSTIGFGDIVPGTKIDSTNPQEKLIIITVYVAVGLSVFAMCFKLMQEEVVSKCKWLARYIGVLKRKVRKHRIERPQQLGMDSRQKDGVGNEGLSPS